MWLKNPPRRYCAKKQIVEKARLAAQGIGLATCAAQRSTAQSEPCSWTVAGEPNAPDSPSSAPSSLHSSSLPPYTHTCSSAAPIRAATPGTDMLLTPPTHTHTHSHTHLQQRGAQQGGHPRHRQVVVQAGVNRQRLNSGGHQRDGGHCTASAQGSNRSERSMRSKRGEGRAGMGWTHRKHVGKWRCS